MHIRVIRKGNAYTGDERTRTRSGKTTRMKSSTSTKGRSKEGDVMSNQPFLT